MFGDSGTTFDNMRFQNLDKIGFLLWGQLTWSCFENSSKLPVCVGSKRAKKSAVSCSSWKFRPAGAVNPEQPICAGDVGESATTRSWQWWGRRGPDGGWWRRARPRLTVSPRPSSPGTGRWWGSSTCWPSWFSPGTGPPSPTLPACAVCSGFTTRLSTFGNTIDLYWHAASSWCQLPVNNINND